MLYIDKGFCFAQHKSLGQKRAAEGSEESIRRKAS